MTASLVCLRACGLSERPVDGALSSNSSDVLILLTGCACVSLAAVVGMCVPLSDAQVAYFWANGVTNFGKSVTAAAA